MLTLNGKIFSKVLYFYNRKIINFTIYDSKISHVCFDDLSTIGYNPLFAGSYDQWNIFIKISDKAQVIFFRSDSIEPIFNFMFRKML